MNALIPLNVLIAEPDRETRTALADVLGAFGVRAWGAEDGASALRIARQVPLRASIIDVALPDVPGLKLLSLLRAVCEVPVLFIGATESKEVRMQMADAGVWSFLPRPFDLEVAQLTIQVFATRFLVG